MILLSLGLGLWWATHLFPIYATERRVAAIARLGAKPYRAVFALITLSAVALMVMGYRQADYIAVWTPQPWAVHVNNLLMLAALFLMEAGRFRSFARRHVRHPMLTAVKIWAIAHLMVNGDLASILLFGGILAWAVVAVIGSNRRDGIWERPAAGTRKGLAWHAVFTLVIYAVVVVIHSYVLGVYTFPQ